MLKTRIIPCLDVKNGRLRQPQRSEDTQIKNGAGILC
jgi:imidazole glycerol phosphate synthase subunit HisF